MSRRGVLTLLAALLAPGVALACSCMWAGPFTKVALGTDLVVLGEVRSYHRHGMDVAVLEVLKGKEVRPVIRIWGDTGRALPALRHGLPAGHPLDLRGAAVARA